MELSGFDFPRSSIATLLAVSTASTISIAFTNVKSATANNFFSAYVHLVVQQQIGHLVIHLNCRIQNDQNSL